MAASKSTKKKTSTAKKTTAKKATAKATSKKATAKKATSKKATRKKAAADKPEAEEPKAEKPKAEKPKGEFSSKSVNMGQIISLRPRVSAAFKPEHLRMARVSLEDEGFASVEEAARAVAEKALELSQNKPKHGFRRGR